MGFIVELIFRILIWLVLLPICWVAATPVILVAAFFSKKSYWASVGGQYRFITGLWVEMLETLF